MKYYISKPISHKLDERIVSGIRIVDSESIIVDSIDEADVCVFQSGWTSSSKCISDHHYARNKRIKRHEGYLYIDKYKTKIN